MTPSATTVGPHVIVIGGSMAGLLAARTLSDHCARVTLIERDRFPRGVDQRRGVPQGQHTHGLLASGTEILEHLFPGLTRDLVAQGAVPGDIVHDARWFFEGGHLARPTSDLEGLLCSRPLLEHAVRSRVLLRSNLTTREACQVEGLLSREADGRITGVRLTTGEEIAADLVVDATGRGSRAPQWLEALGYEAPVEEHIEIGLGYTTRLFRREPEHLDGDIAAVIPPTPAGERGGVMLAQEGNRWTVTLMAHFVSPAPEALDGFIRFASCLPSRDIYDVVLGAEPVGPAVSTRFPASVRRRYERLSRFPDGYVVIGDAICSFNPIYGQGMSVAALEALELSRAVADGTTGVALRFFKAAAVVVDTPWAIAAGSDLRIPEAVGPRSAGGTAINAYIAALRRAAQRDPALALAFFRVANLKALPPSLLRPTIVLRVLMGHLSRIMWRRGVTRQPVPSAERVSPGN